ncbi:MAG: hypothetical protein KIS81_04960 [Maricaulaceae bacterium]|nr:hypothetical protein [Maricaulaceae bacterium]
MRCLAIAAAAGALALMTTGAAQAAQTPAEEPVLTLYRGDDGRLRDADGNVYREVIFVRSESRISERGDPDDIICTWRREIGSRLNRRVCMTRGDFIEVRREARRIWTENMGRALVSAQTGGL